MRSDFGFGTYESSADSSIYKTLPIFGPVPEMDVDVYHVPGRNGDIIVDHGNFNNVEIKMEVYIKASGNTWLEKYHQLKNTLMSFRGYQSLRDSLQPGIWRMARLTDIDIKTEVPWGGVIELTFDAKPQIYCGAHTQLNQITTESKSFIGWGTPTELGMTAAAISMVSASRRNNRFILVHIDRDAPNTNYALVAHVDKSRDGKAVSYFNFSDDPRAGSGGGVASSKVATVNCQYIYPQYVRGNWLLIEAPVSYILYPDTPIPGQFPPEYIIDYDHPYDAWFPDVVQINVSNPDPNYEIHAEDLTTVLTIKNAPRAFDKTPVALINGDRILFLSTPANLSIDGTDYPIRSITINWSTLDCITYVGSEYHSLNNYITIGWINPRSDGGLITDYSELLTKLPIEVALDGRYIQAMDTVCSLWRI